MRLSCVSGCILRRGANVHIAETGGFRGDKSRAERSWAGEDAGGASLILPRACAREKRTRERERENDRVPV